MGMDPVGQAVQMVPAEQTVTASKPRGKKRVAVVYQQGNEITEETTLEVPEFGVSPQELAHVQVSVGATVTPAPYESLRVDVSVELPTVVNSAEMGAALKAARRIARVEVLQQMHGLQGKALNALRAATASDTSVTKQARESAE